MSTVWGKPASLSMILGACLKSFAPILFLLHGHMCCLAVLVIRQLDYLTFFSELGEDRFFPIENQGPNRPSLEPSFQALDLSKEAAVFNDTSREEEWFEAVTKSLHPGAKYAKVGLGALAAQGLLLLRFCSLHGSPCHTQPGGFTSSLLSLAELSKKSQKCCVLLASPIPCKRARGH